ncbi:MAG: Anhydro-N-acetylmuramic acid kinase [Syntrophomonadaceae bacterium]|nr:Anhydro-N-acetylmuramic acid kinase [Bacillota bacterium]
MIKELSKLKLKRVIGLMSGTSVNGIDAVLTEIEGSGPGTRVRIIAFRILPYPEELRERLFRIIDRGETSLAQICSLNFEIGEAFARAAIEISREGRIPLRGIQLIGSHGQTLFHMPPREAGDRYASSTLQLGEPSVIAERTGVTTVADFRPRDIAAGGEGAPLVSYVDFILFGGKGRNLALQNIGGIANVTWVPGEGGLDEVVAFDTGPGNMVLDEAAKRLSGGKVRMDRDGDWAAEGRVDEGFLKRLMDDPYLAMTPPKSTGRERYGVSFTERVLKEARTWKLKDEDIMASLTALTARSISKAYRDFLLKDRPIDEIVLSGGGANNRFLVETLSRDISPIPITRIDRYGIPAEAKEALAFAVLANETVCGRANNVPFVTGARRRVILGKIIPK